MVFGRPVTPTKLKSKIWTEGPTNGSRDADTSKNQPLFSANARSKGFYCGRFPLLQGRRPKISWISPLTALSPKYIPSGGGCPSAACQSLLQFCQSPLAIDLARNSHLFWMYTFSSAHTLCKIASPSFASLFFFHSAGRSLICWETYLLVNFFTSYIIIIWG